MPEKMAYFGLKHDIIVLIKFSDLSYKMNRVFKNLNNNAFFRRKSCDGLFLFGKRLSPPALVPS
jgi:hypothetical protein